MIIIELVGIALIFFVISVYVDFIKDLVSLILLKSRK